ncbi:MAG: UDP-phosphate galactose phosphotransferase [Bdellovibrio sp. CG10_big_fil_rev_8_21_14_0_10_47_8]|nr:MAG: UDP-phosphate galactose phosphotransferase [Bdellovibrio sp. CG10_big_fil_rev_8_21_14_0_10_47_8]
MVYRCLKRIFDILLSGLMGCLFFPLFVCLYFLCRLTDPGPVLYWSKRVGINSSLFLMPKIRTMKLDTPQVATHLLTNSDQYLTPMGSFLRKTSLDELPQLFSIFRGDMSFVGPRPALFNQDDLMQLRKHAGVDKLLPGLTGWAQINGRDEISLEEKVQLESEYLKRRSLVFDLRILAMTFLKVLRQESIRH